MQKGIIEDDNFQKGLSVLAFITTIGLFLSSIGICRQIWKRKDTKEISGGPFTMGVIGGSCWWAYGFLKWDKTLLSVTTIQVILYSSYLTFYWIMSKRKRKPSLMIAAAVSIIGLLGLVLRLFRKFARHPLGILCMILNVCDFGAPLLGLKYVIRNSSTSTLPLPLCLANFFVSTLWFTYGLLKNDGYLIAPNGLGALLSTVQLTVFMLYPRKQGGKSLVQRMLYGLHCIKPDGTETSDVPISTIEDAKTSVRSKRLWSFQLNSKNRNNSLEVIGNRLEKKQLLDNGQFSQVLEERRISIASNISRKLIAKPENTENCVNQQAAACLLSTCVDNSTIAPISINYLLLG